MRATAVHLHALSITCLLALVLGCGGDAPPPRDLLPLLAPGAANGAAEGILLGNSQRLALVTAPGEQLEAEVELAGPTWLFFDLGAVGEAAEAPAEVAVEWTADGRRREVFRSALAAEDAWSSYRVELDGLRGRGVLSLRNLRGRPVAWAQPYLVPAERPAGQRPNLILIIVDTLRADRLGSCGYERPTTPRLDRLAGQAWLFCNAYSPSTWTLPSGASLLTGLLPEQHGVQGLEQRLPAEVTTAAERLRDAGYRTVAFTDGGFFDPRWGIAQGFERYDRTPGSPRAAKDIAHITGAAQRWLADAPIEPFFLLVHTYEAHQPYVNREGFADPFLVPGYDGPYAEGAEVRYRDLPLPAADLEHVVGLYDGGVRRADHYLGQLLDAVRREGLFERSAILVTSDHGEELQEHGSIEHGQGRVFEENVRVPLLLKPPGAVAARRVETRVSGVDVVPTLFQLAGLEPAPGLPGRSLLAPAAERPLLVHGLNSLPKLHENRVRFDLGERALVFDRVRAQHALYDLGRDPGMHLPEHGAAAEDPLLHLAQAGLAWLEVGAFAARLPPGLTGLRVPQGSRVAPLKVLAGGRWLELASGEWAELAPALPSVLVFELAEARGAPVIEVRPRGGEAREETLLRRHTGGDFLAWHPLAPDLPPPYVIFRTISREDVLEEALSLERREELEALGYL